MVWNTQFVYISLKQQGQDLHTEIDNLVMKIQSEVNDMNSQQFAAIDKHEQKIKNTIKEISETILDLKKCLQS